VGGRAGGWQRWCRIGAEVVAPVVFFVSLNASDPDHPGRIVAGEGSSHSQFGRAITDRWPAFAAVAAVVVGLAVVGNLRFRRSSM
jgi:hypothetical protein